MTNSLVVTLAGSGQVVADLSGSTRDNGISYPIVVQTPQYQVDSLGALQNLPITAAGATRCQMLGGLADITRASTQRGRHRTTTSSR